MKRYKVCPVCGARAMIEYGSVLREHSWPKAGAGGVHSICHGPRPTPPANEPLSSGSPADQGEHAAGQDHLQPS